MKIKIFDGWVDFYNFLEKYELLQVHDGFEPFIAAYNRINVGCGCKKAVRIKETEDAFITAASSILREEKVLNKIKTTGQFTEVQIYLNGNLFFKG